MCFVVVHPEINIAGKMHHEKMCFTSICKPKKRKNFRISPRNLPAPISKWLVTPLYNPFRPLGRGTTLLINYGYQPLANWDDPPSRFLERFSPDFTKGEQRNPLLHRQEDLDSLPPFTAGQNVPTNGERFVGPNSLSQWTLKK